MGFWIRGLIAIVMAVFMGLGSAYWAISTRTLGAAISNGPWQTNALIGSEALDIYTRAGVSVAGLFALNRSEAVYFTATTDSDGEPLQGSCVYQVEGTDMPARWWSITAYGADHFLIPNAEKRYSMTRADLLGLSMGEGAATGSPEPFTFRMARERQPGAWLPLGDAALLSLTLRLYGMPEALTDEDALEADLSGVALPVIKRETCS